MGGREVKALVGTGCSTTVMASYLMPKCEGKESSLMAVDGRETLCEGEENVELTVQGIHLSVNAIILGRLVDGVDLVLGMDAISQLGGVVIADGEPVKFGKVMNKCYLPVRNEGARCAVMVEKQKLEKSDVGKGKPHGNINDELRKEPCKVDYKDFAARFDGERWEVEWLWQGERLLLKNRIGCYEHSLKGRVKEEFDREVERWIDEGILVPWEGVEEGVLPLMAVIQPTKNKIRPVLDFRDLNGYVMCHTGDDVADVCGEILRKWRQMRGAWTLSI